MNVTDVPAQIAPDGDAAILTVGVTVAFTTIVIVFDNAVVDVKQLPPPVIVIVQVTISLLTSEVVV